MDTVQVDIPTPVESYFDDGGLSAESAHRISDLFERIAATQERFGVVPSTPTPALIALEGFVHDALYKENALDTEARLMGELQSAEREFTTLDDIRRTNWELGVDHAIAERSLDLLRRWRNTGDRDVFRQHSIIAENTQNEARRYDDARAEVTRKKKALAEHRSQHPAIYPVAVQDS